MQTYEFETVDVFTERRFGGNPLAVFPDARGMSASEMQALAAEFNLSESAFVLPPEKPAHNARVRIFHRTAEMPFAGHPLVGTGYVLARKGLDRNGVLLLEVPAGVVRVTIERDVAGGVLGATIAAPQPLKTRHEFEPDIIAACASLSSEHIIVSNHRPVMASVGTWFVIAEVTDEALRLASPDIQAFRRASKTYPEVNERLSLHMYAREPAGLRARMFAPLAGTHEDPATGSANTPLVALLLSLTDEPSLDLTISQGVEMGRPSLLQVRATREDDGIRATVSGRCVPVLRGEALVGNEGGLA
jgi:trans-2,3-dihydro-3-hydroxyanthranilate isomerase